MPTPASVKAAADKAKGNVLANMEFDSDITNVKTALERVSPWATGWGAYLSSLPNTEAMALADIVETVKSGQFLNNLKILKEASATGASGLGSVTEKEGAKVEGKIRTLNPKSKTFVDDLKYILNYMEKLKEIKAQQTPTTLAPAFDPPAAANIDAVRERNVQKVMAANPKITREQAIQALQRAGKY
jgi:hypothetical protein